MSLTGLRLTQPNLRFRPIVDIRLFAHQSPMHRRLLAVLVLLLTGSCSDREAFCCGYSIEHQGGSKVSLLHDGLVVESYIVTGVFEDASLTVFELRPYNARECSYRVATPPDRLSPPMLLGQLDRVRPGLTAAIRGDSSGPLNSRSCLAKRSTAS
jgi:hypothetical protein